MDKNNDIKVNKVDKWDKGVADESLWQAKKSVDMFLCGYSSMLSIEALDAVRTIYVFLDEALDHFNELEARHQKDTGMISEYEEENKSLKSELDIKTDECDALISRVFKQDDEYTKLEAESKKLRENNELCMKAHLRLLDESTKLATENEKLRENNELCMKAHLRLCDDSTKLEAENKELRSKCESKENALQKMIHEVAELEKEKIDLEVRLTQSDEMRYRNAKYAWAIKTVLKKASYSPGHVAEELRFMAKKSTTPKEVFERWEGISDELLGEHSKLVEKIERLEKKNAELSSQVSSLQRMVRLLYEY